MIFTAMPVLNLAVFNVFPGIEAHMRYPALYSMSKNSFNFKRLFFYQILGLFQSVLLYFLFNHVLGVGKSSDGLDRDQWFTSTGMFCCLVITVTVEVMVCTDYFTLWSICWIALSIASWFVFMGFYSELSITPDVFGVFLRVMRCLEFWLWMIVVVVSSTIPEIAYRFLQRQYFPRLGDLVLEKECTVKTAEVHNSSMELPTLKSGSPVTRRSSFD
jgi:magnesium-transporting ATPase (P-type)